MIGIVLATVLSLGEISTPDWIASTGRYGSAYQYATVFVYKAGTKELAPLYTDMLGTVKDNPFTTGATGKFRFFVEDGDYDVVITKTDRAPLILDREVPMLGGMTLREFWRRYRRFGARLR